MKRIGWQRFLAILAGLLVLAPTLLLYPAWQAKPLTEPRPSPVVVGPLLKGTEAIQPLKPGVRVLAGLDIRLATYGRTNESILRFFLKTADNKLILRQGRIEAQELVDWGLAKWRFEPLLTKPQDEFLVVLDSPDATPETCLAILSFETLKEKEDPLRLGEATGPGSLPVRVVTADPVPPFSSPWVWSGLLLALCVIWAAWPVGAQPVQESPVEPPPQPASRRTVIIVGLLITLATSFVCGWPNLVEREAVRAAGYEHLPTPGDQAWYAEMAHKLGLGKRFLTGDMQSFEDAEAKNPYIGVLLPMGLLAIGDRLLGPVTLAYLIDFLLPALMVLLLYLGAVRLGAGVGPAAIMALLLTAFPHKVGLTMAGVESIAQAWELFIGAWQKPGTYFTSFGHPQTSGPFAVLAGLLIWRVGQRPGWGWVAAAGVGVGAVFYTDLFFLQMVAGSLALVWLTTVARRDWPRSFRFLGVGLIALILGIPYVLGSLAQTRLPDGMERLFEVADPQPDGLLTWNQTEQTILGLTGVLALVYLTLVIRRARNPVLKRAVPDFALDLTFVPVLAFGIWWISDHITGINMQKHHYLWRGLMMWLPIAAGGWGFWWLGRKFRFGRKKWLYIGLTCLVALGCLAKLADLDHLFSRPPYSAANRPPQIASIRPGMNRVVDYLNRQAGPEDVVLTIDYEQTKQLNLLTGCFTYIQTLYNSTLVNSRKADRIGWAFALLGSATRPSDYLDYTIHGRNHPTNPVRGEQLYKKYNQFLIAVWAPMGLRYHDAVARAIEKSDRVYYTHRSPQPGPDRSPYRFDWVLIGPLEKALGVDLDPTRYELALDTEDTQLYRPLK